MKCAVLLLADISGYTSFVREHAKTADHASRSVVALLKAIIAGSYTPLEVAELEGDAVFFYALFEPDEFASGTDAIKRQIPGLFKAFEDARDALVGGADCPCDACTHIGDLQLKQVVHSGEVSLERIGEFEKLFGLDVIVVHRMLKNTVDANQYLMLSDAAHGSFGSFGGVAAEERVERLDGIGEMAMHVYYADELSTLPVVPVPNGEQRSGGWLSWLKAPLAAFGIGSVDDRGRS